MYRIVLTLSPRFGRELPLLLEVPGFSGVRIHAGNRAAETERWILPGLELGRVFVARSREAEAAIFFRITAARTRGEPVSIEVRNPSERTPTP